VFRRSSSSVSASTCFSCSSLSPLCTLTARLFKFCNIISFELLNSSYSRYRGFRFEFY
jgi:hypothetical protein